MDANRGNQSPASMIVDGIIDENDASIFLISSPGPGSKAAEGSSSGEGSCSGGNKTASDHDEDVVNITRAEKRVLLEGMRQIPDLVKMLSAQQGKAPAPVDPIVPAMVQAINMSYTKEDCLDLLSKIFDCVVMTEKSDRSGSKSKKFTIEFDLDIEGTWLQEPPPNTRVKVGNSFETVGLFPSTLKRPIANRYLTPKGLDTSESTIKEEVVSNEFMSSLPLKCKSELLKGFFKEGG